MNPPETQDLVVLVPDADIEQAVGGLLSRPDGLGLAPLEWAVVRHPDRDPGCRVRAVEFLRPYLLRFRRALVVFDREGCGSGDSREDIQRGVEGALSRNGWMDRAKAIVIDPELEVWLWNGSARVAEELGWGRDYSELRDHLAACGLWPEDAAKPPEPKRAAREAMRKARVRSRSRRSPAKFRRLACQVAAGTLGSCEDPAFRELIDTLTGWFPVESADAQSPGHNDM